MIKSKREISILSLCKQIKFKLKKAEFRQSNSVLFQKSLEDRIHELEIALEVVQKNELRDKQTISKLQKQLARVS